MRPQGRAAGMLVYAVASAVSDVRRRRSPRKVAFNVAQYGLSMAAAGGAWALLGGSAPFTPDQLPAFAAAAVVFSLVNNLLVRVTTAFADGRRLATGLVDDAGFEAWTSAMLLGMAPVTVLVAERSSLLLLLLLLPVGAVFIASRGAIQAIAHRAVAEEHARSAAALAEDHARLVEAERAVVRQLQEQDRLKSDLLAAVSHELRTPLTGILGSIKTLDARGHVLSPEQRRKFLDMANQEGERLKGLIEQLLLASNFQTTPSEPSIHPLIDAGDVVSGATAAIQADHPERRFAVTVSGSLPVLAAPEAIRRVLANLLDNAVKCPPPARRHRPRPLRGQAARPRPGRRAGAGHRAGQRRPGRPLRAAPPARRRQQRRPRRPRRQALPPGQLSDQPRPHPPAPTCSGERLPG